MHARRNDPEDDSPDSSSVPRALGDNADDFEVRRRSQLHGISGSLQ